MRIKTDVSGLPEDAHLKSVDFIIRSRGKKKPVRKFSLKAAQFSRGICETGFTLPPLRGKYEIIATATGKNVPAEPRVKSFERNRFEWEHNDLGKSRTVYPPFRPIEVKGNTLCTVLKEYEMNPLGLLDRVTTEHSEGLGIEEILAKPMRYTATIDGRKVVARPASFSFKRRDPDRVVARSAFSLGPLRAKAVSTLEYDGMLRVDLTLLPSPGRKVQKLDLEIPMRGRVARMIHAISCRYRDGAEFTTLPAGQGMIWSAADLPFVGRDENFCNYIFLGDPNRGLCWFTENDRGWSRKTGEANLDVVRRGNDVTLRVHFVSAPAEIATARTITFGLQAAPVKPRLKGWRHRWHTDNFNVLGCDHHWGAPGYCGSVYPAGRNTLIWKAIRRANEEGMSSRDIESVITRCRKNYERYGRGSADGFAVLARRNLSNRRGKRMIFYYNRSSEPLCQEFRTFMDEWCMKDYNDGYRGEKNPQEIMIVPTESFLDYSLHWYARSFEIAGNTGVYMDNIFFAHSLNTAMTGAYTREDGSISGSNGIWHLREQAKRTFQFMNERGMEPIQMAHMTSLEILPILSFYTVQYDWEWQRGRGDVHTRFPREYLLLVSNGEHSGTWPIVLHEQGRLQHDPWTIKTAFGVTIIHEITVDPYFWHGRPIGPEDIDENRLFNTFLKPLHDIGRKQGCEVYRYWDARPQPVKATDPDLPTIVFSRKGIETIFAITNFTPEDKTADVAIDAGTLAFAGKYRVVDMESGGEIPVRKNHVRFPLKAHDLREFRIVPNSTISESCGACRPAQGRKATSKVNRGHH